MKGITNIIWILVVAGILLFAGSYFVGFANLFPASIVADGKTCAVKEGLSIIPIMGYYECKQQGETYLTYYISTGWGWESYVVIPCNEWTRSCEYYKCSNAECSGTQQYLGSSPMGGAYQTPHQLYEYWIKKTFKPYSLWLESRTGTSGWVYQPKQYSCSLPIGKDYCIAGLVCDQNKLYKTGTLDFDQASNFLENWALSPVEYAFENHPDYGDVYCAGQGNLYSYSTVQLTSGCYAYPGSLIGKADCCPGQLMGNALCGDDFKWHTPEVQPSCISDFQCPGQGLWITDYSDINRKTVIASKCIGGQCTSQTKGTTCATNEACPTGTICMLDPYTGSSYCATSGTPPTTPRTPTIITPEVNELINWLVNIIVSFILGAIITGIVLVLSVFTPLGIVLKRIPLVAKLKNPKMFMLVSLIIGLIILFLYAGFVLSFKAMLFGGV